MLFHNALISAAFAVSQLTQESTARCYRPDGSSVGTDYQPCNKDQQSMCCATNRYNLHKNVCRPDNLCYDLTSGFIWRESCTDPTWQDPACLRLCISSLDDTENITGYDSIITLCGDGAYCCGQNNTSCCRNRSGYWIVDGKVYRYDSKPSPSNTTGETSATATSTSVTSPSQKLVPSDRLTGVALGLGLGLGLPLLALLTASIFCIFTIRKRRNGASTTSLNAARSINPPQYESPWGQSRHMSQELNSVPAASGRAELGP